MKKMKKQVTLLMVMIYTIKMMIPKKKKIAYIIIQKNNYRYLKRNKKIKNF